VPGSFAPENLSKLSESSEYCKAVLQQATVLGYLASIVEAPMPLLTFLQAVGEQQYHAHTFGEPEGFD
jgi:hypothetical protein